MNKTTLHALRKAVAAAETTLETECAENGFSDRWDAYRAEEAGERLPESIRVAHDAYIAASHEFYLARDGDRGFLGKYDSATPGDVGMK